MEVPRQYTSQNLTSKHRSLARPRDEETYIGLHPVPPRHRLKGNLQPTPDVSASIVYSSANRNIASAVTPIAEVAGKVALCHAMLDLGRTGDVVSGCEESG